MTRNSFAAEVTFIGKGLYSESLTMEQLKGDAKDDDLLKYSFWF